MRADLPSGKVPTTRGCPRPLAEQVARLAGVVDTLILREKDLDDGAYEVLAREVMRACDAAGIAFVAHGHAEAARRVEASYIHLPLPAFEVAGRPRGFELVGTNVHEVDEVARAEALGAVEADRVRSVVQAGCGAWDGLLVRGDRGGSCARVRLRRGN